MRSRLTPPEFLLLFGHGFEECWVFFVFANYLIHKRFAYDLLRWGAASHSTFQLALGVLDSMLRGFCCDDRWTCGERGGGRTRGVKINNIAMLLG